MTWQPGVVWDFLRALETARELERLNCVWLEEPRPRYAFDELADLSRRVAIPIAGGENNRGVHEYRWMLEQKVFGILQPDVMVADGVAGFREIAALAQSHNKRVIPASRRRQSGHHRPAPRHRLLAARAVDRVLQIRPSQPTQTASPSWKTPHSWTSKAT